ncbi:hypothetical protein L211DRAFT_832697, partial [Terfezia boudieri ATCC MYA-4762]
MSSDNQYLKLSCSQSWYLAVAENLAVSESIVAVLHKQVQQREKLEVALMKELTNIQANGVLGLEKLEKLLAQEGECGKDLVEAVGNILERLDGEIKDFTEKMEKDVA